VARKFMRERAHAIDTETCRVAMHARQQFFFVAETGWQHGLRRTPYSIGQRNE
jgi:hypothetical protein